MNEGAFYRYCLESPRRSRRGKRAQGDLKAQRFEPANELSLSAHRGQPVRMIGAKIVVGNNGEVSAVVDIRLAVYILGRC